MECRLTEPREIAFSIFLFVIFSPLNTSFLNISHISCSKLVWARQVKRETPIWHSISSPSRTIGDCMITQASASGFFHCSWEMLVVSSSTNTAKFTQSHRKKFGDPGARQSHMSAFQSVPCHIYCCVVSYSEDKLLTPDECAGDTRYCLRISAEYS
jgi:hypothetical protein